MTVTLDDVKNYLRIGDDEDVFLQLCIDNAEQYLRDSITDYDSKILMTRFQTKARMYMYLIIQNMFDNRSFSTKEDQKTRYITQSLMLQMQNCTYEVI